MHCAFRSRGETWVMDAEIRFVRILSMKHGEAGLRAAELRGIYHEPDSLLSGPRKEKEASQRERC